MVGKWGADFAPLGAIICLGDAPSDEKIDRISFEAFAFLVIFVSLGCSGVQG
jgi:hypothetical protein